MSRPLIEVIGPPSAEVSRRLVVLLNLQKPASRTATPTAEQPGRRAAA